MPTTDERIAIMLEAAGLPVKSAYRRSEVCRVLGICRRTFQTLVGRYEEDPETGEPLRPDCLDSFKHQRDRRVPYDELVDYLRRNKSYHRDNALDPKQLLLFS